MVIRFKRPENWPDRLADFYLMQSKARFVWGKRDCVMVALDWLRQLTGLDLSAPYRGKYSSREEADELLAQLGGTLEQVASEAFFKAGLKDVAVLRAQRGDIVLFDGPEGQTMGFVGPTGPVFPDAVGLSERPLRVCRRAWRIQ